MSDSTLHETADELALDIEQQIEKNEEKIEELPDFPVGRRAREQSTVPSLQELVEDRDEYNG